MAARDFGKDKTRDIKKRLNPVLKAFLAGVYDENCELIRLKGMWHLLKRIWMLVREYWQQNILETTSTKTKKSTFDELSDRISYINLSVSTDYEHLPAITHCEIVLLFPKPKNIVINMMPFVMSKRFFEECCLPKNLHDYWRRIIAFCPVDEEEIGKICYLTIHENKVKKKCSQRRPGIHTESPGRVKIRSARNDVICRDNRGMGSSNVIKNEIYAYWGKGTAYRGEDRIEKRGGIFMASTVGNSCRVWDCQITNDDLIGELGDVEHLREFLPEGEVMKPNCLYWLTDRTPHESLQLDQKQYRQYFRLVTSQVSLWYEDHSTKNPLGVVPDPSITKIIRGSKFDKDEAFEVID